MSKFQMILASIVTAMWIASLIVRVVHPVQGAGFGVVDSVVLLVYGFIFGVSAIKKAIPTNSSQDKPKEVSQ